MAAIPDWVYPASLALLVMVMAGLLVVLTRAAVANARERRAAVARLLENPRQLQRVWYVQREYNTHHEVHLRARDMTGKVVTLAFPSETPRVWHKLQLAGVIVHAEP